MNGRNRGPLPTAERLAQPQRWQLPPELARARPRPVRLNAAGKLAAAGVVALLTGALAGGVWLYILASRDHVRRALLQDQGSFAQAEVVELSRTRGDQARYLVHYRYTAQGQAYRGRAGVRRREWQKLHVGSPLQVHYWTARPETSWLPGREPKGLPLWVVPLLPACLGLAAWPIIWSLRAQWRLLTEGRPAPARVTHSRRVSSQYGTSHRVHYEFRILSGAVCTGYYDAPNDPPPSGAVLTVVYDPDDPRRRHRYPFTLVRGHTT